MDPYDNKFSVSFENVVCVAISMFKFNLQWVREDVQLF